MISKNKIKYVRSLENKKNRDTLGLYVAEGPKVVGDILERHPSSVTLLVATKSWLEGAGKQHLTKVTTEVIEATEDELAKASFLCHPQGVIGVFRKHHSPIIATQLMGTLSLVLDGVQDPGNLGTIIRVADWFGIEHVVCSKDTVDVYNPKVVQATMGSIARVNVAYANLDELLSAMPKDFPIYGTLLEGNNIYDQPLSQHGFILMGNEGRGLSPRMRSMVSRSLRIPNYPEGRPTADSLNVAIATAVVCAEFRRR